MTTPDAPTTTPAGPPSQNSSSAGGSKSATKDKSCGEVARNLDTYPEMILTIAFILPELRENSLLWRAVKRSVEG